MLEVAKSVFYKPPVLHESLFAVFLRRCDKFEDISKRKMKTCVIFVINVINLERKGLAQKLVIQCNLCSSKSNFSTSSNSGG